MTEKQQPPSFAEKIVLSLGQQALILILLFILLFAFQWRIATLDVVVSEGQTSFFNWVYFALSIIFISLLSYRLYDFETDSGHSLGSFLQKWLFFAAIFLGIGLFFSNSDTLHVAGFFWSFAMSIFLGARLQIGTAESKVGEAFNFVMLLFFASYFFLSTLNRLHSWIGSPYYLEATLNMLPLTLIGYLQLGLGGISVLLFIGAMIEKSSDIQLEMWQLWRNATTWHSVKGIDNVLNTLILCGNAGVFVLNLISEFIRFAVHFGRVGFWAAVKVGREKWRLLGKMAVMVLIGLMALFAPMLLLELTDMLVVYKDTLTYNYLPLFLIMFFLFSLFIYAVRSLTLFGFTAGKPNVGAALLHIFHATSNGIIQLLLVYVVAHLVLGLLYALGFIAGYVWFSPLWLLFLCLVIVSALFHAFVKGIEATSDDQEESVSYLLVKVWDMESTKREAERLQKQTTVNEEKKAQNAPRPQESKVSITTTEKEIIAQDILPEVPEIREESTVILPPPKVSTLPPILQQLEANMVFIKGGTFDMGSEEGGSDEKPVHKVSLSDFYMCKYQVTQKEWQFVMGKNPSRFDGEDLPVEKISWEDVQVFIQKLNQMTGKKYSLPSEAQWEYAAREGGKNLRFGNGKDIADAKEMNFDASKDYVQPYGKEGEYRGKTVPVNSFAPNSLGLYNMSGNVWEWCQDVYNGSFYAECAKQGTVKNPIYEGNGSIRVIRGGSWRGYSEGCRSAYRSDNSPTFSDYILGFRLVRAL